MIRVLAVDDHPMVRAGLRAMLAGAAGIEVVAEASSAAEAVAAARAHQPDVVLMDLRMPRVDGIEATRRLRDQSPAVRVIALTTYADDESVLGALRAGARGYLTKDAGAEDIRTAILSVAAGDATLDPAIQHHVVAALAAEAPPGEPSHPAEPSPNQCEAELPDDLTPREAEVLVLIADGLSNTEIAARLVVSPTTVKSHINHLFAKAGLRDRAQAVRYAYRHGLAEPPH